MLNLLQMCESGELPHGSVMTKTLSLRSQSDESSTNHGTLDIEIQYFNPEQETSIKLRAHIAFVEKVFLEAWTTDEVVSRHSQQRELSQLISDVDNAMSSGLAAAYKKFSSGCVWQSNVSFIRAGPFGTTAEPSAHGSLFLRHAYSFGIRTGRIVDAVFHTLYEDGTSRCWPSWLVIVENHIVEQSSRDGKLVPYNILIWDNASLSVVSWDGVSNQTLKGQSFVIHPHARTPATDLSKYQGSLFERIEQHFLLGAVCADLSLTYRSDIKLTLFESKTEL